jgi:hypothetical protein
MSCSNSKVHSIAPPAEKPSGEGIVQAFDGMWDWISFLETPIDMKDEERTSQMSGMRGRGESWKEWSGTDTFEDAIKLARNGWDEGINEIQKYSAELSEELIGLLHIPEVHYDVVGDQLDIGRFVNDEPEQFMTLVPAEIEREPMLLKMGVNFAASQGVPQKTMITRGAAVVALIDALEKHGKRVQVDAISTAFDLFSYGDTFGIETRVRLKEFGDPLQLANLVYVLAHPSAHRRLAFGSWEHAKGSMRRWLGVFAGGEYGYPLDITGKALEEFDIYVPGLFTTRKMGENAALRYIVSELSEQGIHTKKEAEL